MVDLKVLIIVLKCLRVLNRGVYLVSLLVLINYLIETVLLMYSYYYVRSLKKVRTKVDKATIYLMIPCLNEGVVIKDTLKSMCSSDYANLKIYAIDDASSDNTIQQMQAVDDPRIKIVKRKLPNAQKGKGEALNYVYELILQDAKDNNLDLKECLVGIVDADSKIMDNYFELINGVFQKDKNIVGFQSKVRILNLGKNRAQDLEFAEINNAMQSMRMLSKTVAFGGNGQFSRLSILAGLNQKPWTDSLVEDFDLSLRLYLTFDKDQYISKNDNIYIMQSGIVNDERALIRQRTRWAQGNIQEIKYLKAIFKSKRLKKVSKFEFMYTLLKPWIMTVEYIAIFAMLFSSALLVVVFEFTKEVSSLLILFAMMVFMIFAINFIWSMLYNIHNKKMGEKFSLRRTLIDTYYITHFLIKTSQIYPKAVIKYVRKKNKWEKTQRQESPGTDV